jgi:hypothetical protein
VVLAVTVETRDSEPSPISTGLSSLRVEARGKGIRLSEYSTRALQIVLADTASIHPQAQTLIADELHHTNSLIDSGILRLGAIELVLIDQHDSCPCFPDFIVSTPLLFLCLKIGMPFIPA